MLYFARKPSIAFGMLGWDAVRAVVEVECSLAYNPEDSYCLVFLLTQRCFQFVPCHHQESSLCFSSFVTTKIKMSMDFQCIQMPGMISLLELCFVLM